MLKKKRDIGFTTKMVVQPLREVEAPVPVEEAKDLFLEKREQKEKPTPQRKAVPKAVPTPKASNAPKQNPWMVYLQQVKRENPELTYKEVIMKAKETYVPVSKK